ncbi:MAG: DUF6090 family protein, partial [Cyclobacteriaceae bacterium]
MIRLLRKVRLESASQKRLGKYLLYAIGEIILVVIGILIALAINNANQNRQLAQKERAYLFGLQNEFQTSKRKLEELIRVNRENLNGARQLLNISDAEQIPEDSVISGYLYATFANDITYNPNTSILTEMINTGSLKDISNDSLRMSLTMWIATLDDVVKQENDLRQQREKVLDMLRTEEYSIRTIMDQAGITDGTLGIEPADRHASNAMLLQSREFENNLLMFISATYQ